MKSNKSLGNNAEKKVRDLLFEKGYWVTSLQDKVNGQPFDIIAIRNEKALCIEVKHIENKDYLLMSRIEENQRNAFELLAKTGSAFSCKVFCVFDDDENKIYYFDYHELKDLKKVSKKEMFYVGRLK